MPIRNLLRYRMERARGKELPEVEAEAGVEPSPVEELVVAAAQPIPERKRRRYTKSKRTSEQRQLAQARMTPKQKAARLAKMRAGLARYH